MKYAGDCTSEYRQISLNFNKRMVVVSLIRALFQAFADISSLDSTMRKSDLKPMSGDAKECNAQGYPANTLLFVCKPFVAISRKHNDRRQ